ncbi:sulfite exporter TauE/SafE family protein [Xylophilus sp. ASV27]|uniref:sulfite exporter TauE/SafE family protein n=1 Tax=Xylophilus sp. ASV27 TaxID=2795129 RepID=UPI0018ED7A27|nr:sulfite exporter TauE/SafE family protein [Xylophilus sp. ASV27]
MVYLLLALFGGLSGVTTVLFGFGGGFVVVPLLYRVLGAAYDAHDAAGEAAMHIAVATSTCVMVINALAATRRHARAGNIDWPAIRTLAAFIGVGAVLGAGAAVAASADLLRWAFVVYLGITILDCLLRQGFMSRRNSAAPRPLAPAQTVGGGLIIGLVATFLGVGGSVMTVPLLRRRGFSMTRATAMANPLSLPVAIAGTATYMAMAWFRSVALGPWHAGYVDLLAFAVLAVGSLLGIRLTSRYIGRIPDRLHARVYIGLLAVVMLSMMLP